jgi:hypothetical protein
MGRAFRLLLAIAICCAPLGAAAGPQTGPSGGVGVSVTCEAFNDSSFTGGTDNATDGIQYVFPAGGGNLARTQLGYTVGITRTLLSLDSSVALPTATSAGDCLVGGNLSVTEPISFTGVFTSTVEVQLSAILDNWIIEVPDTAPVGTDASLSLQAILGSAQAFESFVVTPSLGVVPSQDPGAWSIDPLGGGRFAVSGSLTFTETLSTASPPSINFFADSFAFTPLGAVGISVTNTVSQALRFEIVSLQPGAEVFALGVEPPVEEPQTKAQQKCLVALNQAAAKVARAQTKVNEKCLKDASKGKESSLQGCAISDPKDKVLKASLKVMKADDKKCQADGRPSFSYVAGSGLYVIAMDEGLSFLQDLLGADPDLAIRSDKSEVGCQGKVLKLSDKLIDVILKEAIKAKKQALAQGAASADQLQAAIEAALGAAEKLLRAEDKVVQTAEKKCAEVVDLGAVFPGAVSVGTTPADVSSHAIENARCRACRLLNQFDALDMDCDAFDEGATNGSCS